MTNLEVGLLTFIACDIVFSIAKYLSSQDNKENRNEKLLQKLDDKIFEHDARMNAILKNHAFSDQEIVKIMSRLDMTHAAIREMKIRINCLVHGIDEPEIISKAQIDE